jgi:putative SOS response-associated peptidase YedK
MIGAALHTSHRHGRTWLRNPHCTFEPSPGGAGGKELPRYLSSPLLNVNHGKIFAIMCGRFSFDIPAELLAKLFGLEKIPGLTSRYNIAPTQEIPVVRQGADGLNRFSALRWGLVPSWAKEVKGAPLINARSETVAEKPAFRQALRYRRCLVPASGFYEWKQEGKGKIPHHITLKDASPMLFAGIWESWKSPTGDVLESCAILTTAANVLMASIHDRQPVILHPAEFKTWLDREITDAAPLSRLYQPYPAELMRITLVLSEVNAVRKEGPQLTKPAGQMDLLLSSGGTGDSSAGA